MFFKLLRYEISNICEHFVIEFFLLLRLDDKGNSFDAFLGN